MTWCLKLENTTDSGIWIMQEKLTLYREIPCRKVLRWGWLQEPVGIRSPTSFKFAGLSEPLSYREDSWSQKIWELLEHTSNVIILTANNSSYPNSKLSDGKLVWTSRPQVTSESAWSQTLVMYKPTSLACFSKYFDIFSEHIWLKVWC